jgi:hypothetical protein
VFARRTTLINVSRRRGDDCIAEGDGHSCLVDGIASNGSYGAFAQFRSII